MSTSALLVVLVAVALVVSVAALAVGITAVRRSQAGPGRRTPRRRVADLPTDVEGLRNEVHALRLEAAQALRHLAVVRYDAFGDMGGHLSWSMALLDDSGDGVVLTSIHGRSEARTYAKNVTSWSSEQQLSPEELEAVKFAKAAV
jgi:outer membrane murein-binding lipoprotein Lpp